jgi:hypothetical protein
MPMRTVPSILAEYKCAFTLLEVRGFNQLLQRLDDKTLRALQAYISEANIDFKLTPPHIHFRKDVERAIRTFKSHVITGLGSSRTTTNFPLNLWEHLLQHGLLALDLLWRSRIDPRLSAQAEVHGAFDYNKTQLAPHGTNVLIHDKPSVWYTCPPMPLMDGTSVQHCIITDAIDYWHGQSVLSA